MNITLNLDIILKKNYNNSEYYDWKCAIGMDIHFTYYDNSGFIKIKEYDSNKSILVVTYKNCDFNITTTRFVNKQIGFVNYIKFTNPEKLKYLVNEEDALKYKKLSGTKIKVKCDKCNTIFDRKVSALTVRGIGCKVCGDGISYPEKFMRSVLKQSNNDFIQQMKVNINDSYRYYDFVLESKKIIIEMDGDFHYSDKVYGMTIDEIKEIDSLKDKWAIDNGYKMIRIDSRESNIEYLKDKVVKSELSNIIDISKINWNTVSIDSESKMMLDVCKFKNDNPDLFSKDIAEKFGIGITTLLRYLKRGTELGVCEYNPNEEKKRYYASLSFSISAFNKNGDLVGDFESIEDCSRKFYELYKIKIDPSNIGAVIKGRLKTCKGYTFIKK